MSYTAPQLTMEAYGEANIRLGKIEAEEGVTILFAVESGSRAWGFPSADSDYDVRFFYVRPLSSYISLRPPRDVIERPIEEPWDLNGWDLRKALQLLIKGNATVAEWLSSPLIYREHGPFPYKLRDLIKRNASPRASARHYFGLTDRCYKSEIACRPTPDQIDRAAAAGQVIKGITTVNLKKYFYAVRGAAAIAWIRRYEEVPPMTLPHLLSYDILPDSARQIIKELLATKATMGEVGHGPRRGGLDAYIEEQLAWVREHGMDKAPDDPEFEREADHLLLEALGIA